MSIRDAARRIARGRPRAVYSTGRLLHRLGAPALGLRLERAADVVTVCGPSGRPFGLYRIDGRDQIANAFRTDGWHAFERPLPDVFARLAGTADGLIVDVGANTGFYSLLAASVETAHRIVAFEPYPPAAEIMRNNLHLNSDRRVELRTVALSRGAGSATLHVPDPEHGLVETSASLNHDFRDEGTTTLIEVEVSSLDIQLGDQAEPVALVKIDVESTELDVLVGGETVIARDRPVIIVEVLHVVDTNALDAFRDRHSYVDIRLRPDDVTVGDAVRFDPDAWNHVWVPGERLDEALAVCTASGLEISRLPQ